MELFKKSSALFMTFFLIFSMFISNNHLFVKEVFAVESDNAITDAETNDVNIENDNENFAFPTEMKAVKLYPGIDFFKDFEQSDEKTYNEINNLFLNLEEMEMNSVIIDINYEDIAYYSLEPGITPAENAMKMLIEIAKKNLYYVYINFDINSILKDIKSDVLEEKINYLTQVAYRFSSNYFIDGVVIDGYYSTKSSDNFNAYINSSSGIGFENWLMENGGYIFSLISNSVKKTDSTIPVGISINNVWANLSSQENGSDTSENFEALKDGYSDTVSYINKGYADFILLNTKGAIDDNEVPFKTITKWWSDIANSNSVPLFVSHTNENLMTDKEGWEGEDQILKQLIAIRDLSNYKGSAFSSLKSLNEQELATKNMVKWYNGNIDEDALNNEIQMNKPKKTDFSTYDAFVEFQGTFDENFDVKLDDTPVKINEAGYFYIVKELDPGMNYFTFESKGKKITYTIKRNIQVIKSYQPQNDMRVEGKTNVEISVMAFDGSNVSATINGETIELTPSKVQSSEENEDGSYKLYSATYKVPEGKEGREQNLGNIQIKGSYKNVKTENETGGQIVVNALPVHSTGTGWIMVKNDNTPTYDYYSNSTSPTPDCAMLPKGTVDYAIRIVTYTSVHTGVKYQYYLTDSGKRIETNDVTLLSDQKEIVGSSVKLVSSYIDDNDTVLKLSMSNKVPFTIGYSSPQYYESVNGKYEVDDFNSSQIFIDFDFVSTVSGTLTPPQNSIFKSSSWTTSNGKQRLVLNLSKAGIYSGVKATYDDDGSLLLKFNDYNDGISGSVIVIDPGHGWTAPGTWDPGAQKYVIEQEINWEVSKKLRDKLESLGAKVYLLPTNSSVFPTIDRGEQSWKYDADLFISIHSNSHTNSSGSGDGTRGSEVFYFNPFSQPFADALADGLGNAWKNIYSYGKNRGAKNGAFWVTLKQDCPSVLIELGFVSDYKEAMELARDSSQNKLVDGIAKGIQNYFNRK